MDELIYEVQHFEEFSDQFNDELKVKIIEALNKCQQYKETLTKIERVCHNFDWEFKSEHSPEGYINKLVFDAIVK